jgi:hypothetical protein
MSASTTVSPPTLRNVIEITVRVPSQAPPYLIYRPLASGGWRRIGLSAWPDPAARFIGVWWEVHGRRVMPTQQLLRAAPACGLVVPRRTSLHTRALAFERIIRYLRRRWPGITAARSNQ